MMQLVDTHCHIHSTDYKKDAEVVYNDAYNKGISKIICVGTDEADSHLAVEFAQVHDRVWASVGVHPHEAKKGVGNLKKLVGKEKVVAIGEVGLDYFYTHSPKQVQIKLLEEQLQLAVDHQKPVIFHVREAYDDFWPIFNQFKGIKGVLHSYTDSMTNLEKALERDLFIGVNGIATFSKDIEQREMLQRAPLNRLLLETDSPYLTPSPHRGKVNEPAYVRLVAEYMRQIRSTTLEEIATQTTRNATYLFQI